MSKHIFKNFCCEHRMIFKYVWPFFNIMNKRFKIIYLRLLVDLNSIWTSTTNKNWLFWTSSQMEVRLVFFYIFNSFMIDSLSYWNQSIDLFWKSIDWFLYDKDFCHEKAKEIKIKYKIFRVNFQVYIWIF